MLSKDSEQNMRLTNCMWPIASLCLARTDRNFQIVSGEGFIQLTYLLISGVVIPEAVTMQISSFASIVL